MRLAFVCIWLNFSICTSSGQDSSSLPPQRMSVPDAAEEVQAMLVQNAETADAIGVVGYNVGSMSLNAPSHVQFNPVNLIGNLLKISNIPYGVWLEIEGEWYQHVDSTGLKPVFVQISEEWFSPRSVPRSIVLKFGRSPRDIRLGENSRTAEITLLAGKTIEFDFVREFGDRPFASGMANSSKLPSQGQYVSSLMSKYTPVPASGTSGGGPVSSTIQPASPSPTLAFQFIDRGSNAVGFTLDGKLTSTPTPTLTVPSQDSIDLLKVMVSADILPMLISQCEVIGKVTVTYTTASGKKDTAVFDKIGLTVTLDDAVRSSDPNQIELTAKLTNGYFEKAISEQRLKEFFLNAASTTKDSEAVFELSETKIRFNNGLFKDQVNGAVTYDAPQLNIKINLFLKKLQQ